MPNEPYCDTDVVGTKRWFLNNGLHREDGPAIEHANGSKCWYINGKRHRVEVDPETGLTMSAIEYASGYKSWCLNGRLHREDGPAIENANGDTEYWINDKRIPQLDNKRIYGKEKLQKFLMLI